MWFNKNAFRELREEIFRYFEKEFLVNFFSNNHQLQFIAILSLILNFVLLFYCTPFFDLCCRIFSENIKKDTWEHWSRTEMATIRTNDSNRPSWLKAIVVDGGAEYGGNPYVICSNGQVKQFSIFV